MRLQDSYKKTYLWKCYRLLTASFKTCLQVIFKWSWKGLQDGKKITLLVFELDFKTASRSLKHRCLQDNLKRYCKVFQDILTINNFVASMRLQDSFKNTYLWKSYRLLAASFKTCLQVIFKWSWKGLQDGKKITLLVFELDKLKHRCLQDNLKRYQKIFQDILTINYFVALMRLQDSFILSYLWMFYKPLAPALKTCLQVVFKSS